MINFLAILSLMLVFSFNSIQASEKELEALAKKKSAPTSSAVTRAPASTSCGDWGGLGVFGIVRHAGREAGVVLILAGLAFSVGWIFYSIGYLGSYVFSNCGGKEIFAIYPYYAEGSWRAYKPDSGKKEEYGSRNVFLKGGSFILGIQSDKILGIGLATDVGYHRVKEVREGVGEVATSNGSYFQTGPRFFYNWNKSNSYTYMDLLAGTSNRNDIGYFATARWGVDIGFGNKSGAQGIKLGANYGIGYMDLKNRDSFFNDETQWGGIWQVHLGYQF